MIKSIKNFSVNLIIHQNNRQIEEQKAASYIQIFYNATLLKTQSFRQCIIISKPLFINAKQSTAPKQELKSDGTYRGFDFQIFLNQIMLYYLV